MSVLIPGMEMPTSCDDCRLNNGISCYAVLEYMEDGVVGRTNDRPDWCPIVPVPDHGRLIDADEFLKRAISTKCFRGDCALMLEELVGESTTIIPASKEGEG